jgi:hypothetical protein
LAQSGKLRHLVTQPLIQDMWHLKILCVL